MATRSMAGRIGWTLGVGGALAGGLALWSAAVARKAQAAVPQDGALQPVPGARLHFTDTGGDGPVVVMLHGIYAQLRNFSYALAERLEGEARLILVDRPGWGWSRVDRDQPTLVEQARMIADFLAARDLSDVTLLGHSMGGGLALATAVHHPDRLRRLALVAPFSRPITSQAERLRGIVNARAFRAAAAWTAPGPVSTFAPAMAAAVVFAPDPYPPEYLTRGGGALALQHESIMAGLHELGHANRMISGLSLRWGEIALPTAILFGHGDRVLDPEMHGARTAEAIPGATLTMVEGGHMLPVTHPDVVAGWLRELLAR